MPQPIATDLATLLLAVRTKLVTDGVFTGTNTCFLSLNPDDLEYPPSDQFAVITPKQQVVDQSLVVGGGNDTLYFEGQFTVTLWSRLALDQTPRSDSWLTDGTLGALKVVRCVINSLQLYQPLDGSNNQLQAEPMRLVSIDSYSREYQKVGWGAVRLVFSLKWWASFGC